MDAEWILSLVFITTLYHPQTSGQVEISNWGIKQIPEKTIRLDRKDSLFRLDDALLACKIALKTPIGMSKHVIYL